MAGSVAPTAAPVATLGYSFLAAGFASLLVGVVVGGGRPLEARWLRTVGHYSYAVYMLHFPILEIAVRTRLGAALVRSRLGWATLTVAVAEYEIAPTGPSRRPDRFATDR